MFDSVLSRLCILIFLAIPACLGQLEYAKSDTLETLLTEPNSLAIVAFCMPWYDPCKALATELETAQATLRQWASIVLADCDEEPDFCFSHGILSHPTIRVLKDGEETRYRGKLKAPAIITEVMTGVLPPVSVADKNTFEAVKASDRPLLLLTHEADDATALEVFSSVAQSVRGTFFTMTTTDAQLSGTRAKLPHIAVFNSLDGTTPVYEGAFQLDDILRFTKQVSSPLIAVLDLPVLTASMKSGVPLGMIFADDDTQLTALADSLKNVALKYRGQVNFAIADAKKLGFMAQALGLDPKRYPAFALQARDGAHIFNQDLGITGDAVDRFIRESLGGLVITHAEL